jgi:hypothetical protein
VSPGFHRWLSALREVAPRHLRYLPHSIVAGWLLGEAMRFLWLHHAWPLWHAELSRICGEIDEHLAEARR